MPGDAIYPPKLYIILLINIDEVRSTGYGNGEFDIIFPFNTFIDSTSSYLSGLCQPPTLIIHLLCIIARPSFTITQKKNE